MEILGILFLLAIVYFLLHPLRALGLIIRLALSVVVLIIILAFVGMLLGGGHPNH
jgi:hypothetical protein